VFSRGADKTSLASYIRLFEPMVIKALKVTVPFSVLHCIIRALFSESFVIKNWLYNLYEFLKMVCQKKISDYTKLKLNSMV
jgi:hypothetical protein